MLFLPIHILLVKTIRSVFNMAGKFWRLKIQPMSPFQGLMCPTVIHDFPVK